MTGRPTSLTEAVFSRIVDALILGATNEIAARYGGVSETSFYEWVRAGKRDDEEGKDTIFTQFMKAVKAARAESDIADLSTIKNAINSGTWQAAAWRLERRYPKDFGRSTRGDDPPPTTILRFEVIDGPRENSDVDAHANAGDAIDETL